MKTISRHIAERLLESNWVKIWFAFSAAAFVGLQISRGNFLAMILNILVAFILAIFFEYKYKILDKLFEFKSKRHILISLLIAIYTVIEILLVFYGLWAWLLTVAENSIAVGIRSSFSEQFIETALFLLIILTGIVALFFVFAAVYAVVIRFKKIIDFANNVLLKAELQELIYFSATMLTFGVFAIILYNLSPIFWGDQSLHRGSQDFIFGADIGAVFYRDSQFYFASANIRRLFYPLVQFPFVLLARALGRIFFFAPFSFVYFVHLFHIALMAVSGILLARMCTYNEASSSTSGFSKTYFLLLYTASFPFMVFSTFVERYVLPTFCIILLMYIFIHVPGSKFKSVAALAAAGTLTPGVVMFPFITYGKNIKKWFKNFFKLAIVFIVICIFCGVLPILFNSIHDILADLANHGGTGISINQRALQFITFVSTCFISAETELINRIDLTDTAYGFEYTAYIMSRPKTVNWVGIVMIALSVAGFIINRKLRFAQMSFLWTVFAFFALFVMGWQARENEMFLSALYFGWAFFVLVFIFFEKLLEKQTVIKYVIYSVMLIVMAVININGIIELVQFGIQHYPAR